MYYLSKNKIWQPWIEMTENQETRSSKCFVEIAQVWRYNNAFFTFGLFLFLLSKTQNFTSKISHLEKFLENTL